MARGKQIDNETIYKIMLSMMTTNNFSETARQLGMPMTTVEQIYKKHKDDEEYVRLRDEKRNEFVEKASEIMYKAMNRLSKELDSSDKIPVNNLSTVIGTMYDKMILEKGDTVNNTPTVKVEVVDNSGLERVMYEED